MDNFLKILILEDSIIDAEIELRLLKKRGLKFESKLAMNKKDFLLALDQFEPDLILSDNSLPQFNATEALEIIHQRSIRIPFILVTGTVSEEFAAGIIKLGADDYILKDRLTRLPAAIESSLQKKKAEQELKEMEQQILYQKIQEQKKITRAIINAQEQERNHIGKELHDNINQILAGTKLYLGMAAKKNETVRQLVKYPMELIDNSIEEIRLLSSRQVTPLRNINLEELTEWLIDNLNKTTSIKTLFVYQVTEPLQDDDLKLNIYRIIQELINNITKHAKCKNVSIFIKQVGTFINVEVTDDGKGFDVNQKRNGIGISNMMNRIESFNGKMEIETSPGNGSKIKISLPY